MEKLYKMIDGVLFYQEAWLEKDGAFFHHWGRVGEIGEHTETPVGKRASEKRLAADALAQARLEGYSAIDVEDHQVLLIEFAVVGFGTAEELTKRRALQRRMDETLGWVGIGHCDGGSSGSNSMEVCCYVVDFAIAKRVIEQDLVGTEFADYTRIYLEDA
jgi:hypothetical protein